jgi:hypothetical protein
VLQVPPRQAAARSIGAATLMALWTRRRGIQLLAQRRLRAWWLACSQPLGQSRAARLERCAAEKVLKLMRGEAVSRVYRAGVPPSQWSRFVVNATSLDSNGQRADATEL